MSPIQNSGASGCDSAGNLSSDSNLNLESGTTSGTNISNDDFKPTQLTASILIRHNEDMEKIMIQRHKKERSHIKDREIKKKLEKHTNDVFGDRNEVILFFRFAFCLLTNFVALQQYHGVKRSVSHSWEEDCHKISKHDHQNVVTKESGANNLTSNFMGTNLDLPTTSMNLTDNMLQTVSFSNSLTILLQKCPRIREKIIKHHLNTGRMVCGLHLLYP